MRVSIFGSQETHRCEQCPDGSGGQLGLGDRANVTAAVDDVGGSAAVIVVHVVLEVRFQEHNGLALRTGDELALLPKEKTVNGEGLGREGRVVLQDLALVLMEHLPRLAVAFLGNTLVSERDRSYSPKEN